MSNTLVIKAVPKSFEFLSVLVILDGVFQKSEVSFIMMFLLLQYVNDFAK